jgi:hypothetical protein
VQRSGPRRIERLAAPSSLGEMLTNGRQLAHGAEA